MFWPEKSGVRREYSPLPASSSVLYHSPFPGGPEVGGVSNPLNQMAPEGRDDWGVGVGPTVGSPAPVVGEVVGVAATEDGNSDGVLLGLDDGT